MELATRSRTRPEVTKATDEVRIGLLPAKIVRPRPPTGSQTLPLAIGEKTFARPKKDHLTPELEKKF